MALPAPIAFGLGEVSRRFDNAGVAYVVGGSTMLRLSGIDVTVGDIDVVVAGSDRAAVDVAIEGLIVEFPDRREPWRTEWLVRGTLETPAGSVALDVMGGLALIIDGKHIRFPLVVERRETVGGYEVPLACLAHWYHVYRVHNPDRAMLIRKHLDEATLERAARDLSIRY